MKEAHLTRLTVLRSETNTRAFSITEKIEGNTQREVMNFLDVEKSARYKPANGLTYCNIYAHDFARLMGGYIPRVWWVDTNKQEVVKYGVTVREMNANSLYKWFGDFGHVFNWHEVTRDEAQHFANQGYLVTCVASNLDPRRSGHITMIVAEDEKNKKKLDMIVQSQAGRQNHKIFVSNWYNRGHNKPRFYVHGSK